MKRGHFRWRHLHKALFPGGGKQMNKALDLAFIDLAHNIKFACVFGFAEGHAEFRIKVIGRGKYFYLARKKFMDGVADILVMGMTVFA